jgi:hypothetical protein
MGINIKAQNGVVLEHDDNGRNRRIDLDSLNDLAFDLGETQVAS